MQTPLVSIIIPTYNRARLIGETLDSVLAQTYANWECIVVDDGSTDETDKLLAEYCKKDARFQYHHRPKDRPKGANACRNYGFELSKGEYINWFDSDDLMTDDCIETKINGISNHDFVFSYSLDFNETEILGKVYILDENIPISAENFISQTKCWMTIDALINKKSIRNLRFNEILKSGQEYNFFARYLYQTTNGKFINKCLAKRRIHRSSIQQELLINENSKNKELIENEVILLEDLSKVASVKIINRSLNRIVRFSYLIHNPFTVSIYQFKVIKKLVKFKKIKALFYYCTWVLSNLFLGKGYFFIRKTFN